MPCSSSNAMSIRSAMRSRSPEAISGNVRRILAILVVAAALPLAPISGQEAVGRWSLTASGVWFSPAGDEVVVSQGMPLAAQREVLAVSEDATGFALGLEYRWRPRIGLELGALLAEMDSTYRVEVAGRTTFADTETMDLESLLLGVNWHLTPERRIDLSIGGFVAQTKPADTIFLTEVGRRVKQVFDDDLGVGVKVGLETSLRSQSAWGLAASVRYLDTIMESETPGQDLDLDPVILTAGARYRF